MKQVVTTTANFHAVIQNGNITPEIEVGITLCEPHYELSTEGVSKSRKSETFRFSADPDTLRKLADGLIDFANDCEAEFGKAMKKEESQ